MNMAHCYPAYSHRGWMVVLRPSIYSAYMPPPTFLIAVVDPVHFPLYLYTQTHCPVNCSIPSSHRPGPKGYVMMRLVMMMNLPNFHVSSLTLSFVSVCVLAGWKMMTCCRVSMYLNHSFSISLLFSMSVI